MKSYIFINRYRRRIKTFLIAALLLGTGIARAQVVIEGNVYGGGNIGTVSENTNVVVNSGTVGRKLTLKERRYDSNGQVQRIEFGNVYGGGNGFYQRGTTGEGVPVFDGGDGQVFGNTNVTITGDAVVRHAVFGGGNMGSVGTFNSHATEDEGTVEYTSGGKAVVTVGGNAVIGPTKNDLTTATDSELTEAAADFGMASMSQAQYTDTAFKYLGGNEGGVFGSSRGLAGAELKFLSFTNTTVVMIKDNANVVGEVFGGGENGHVQKGTNVTVCDNAVIGGVEIHDAGGYTVVEGIYQGANYTLNTTESEIAEDEYGVGRRIFRGNVFGGGKGTDYVSWLPGTLGYYSGRVYGGGNGFYQRGTTGEGVPVFDGGDGPSHTKIRPIPILSMVS